MTRVETRLGKVFTRRSYNKPTNMKPHTLILATLTAALLSACDMPQAVTRTKEGGYMVENGGTFSWKADSESRDLDVTMPDGVHIVMHRAATKPDGTEWTKYFTAYELPVAIGRQGVQVARSNNAVKVATDKPTILTSTGADGSTTQSAVFNPAGQSFFGAGKH
jgi:hypothetical protein